MPLFSRNDNSFLSRWWWTVDHGIMAGVCMLMVFGVLMITTASPAVAERIGLSPYHFLIRHLVFLLPSVFIFFGTSMLKDRHIWRIATVIFLGSLIAMVFVLFAGMEIKGARRWVHVLGLSLQPSEFAKPAFLIVSGWFMAQQKTRADLPGYVVSAILYVIMIFLLLLQPDLGMTVIVTLSWAAQVFLAGFPFRLLLAFCGLGAGGLVFAYFSFAHVHSRIDRFLNPDVGDNYQVEKSLESFRNGGILGQGPGQGEVKMHLPDAHADFTFSVTGEEMGFIAVLFLIALFNFLIVKGLYRLKSSNDLFNIIASGGLLTMFGLQALVHMGSCLNLLPAKGMTLPFISYGGSSLISMGFAMGAVLALTRKKIGGHKKMRKA